MPGEVAVLDVEGIRQIGHVLKGALSMAFLLRARDFPKLFLLLQAFHASNFAEVLRNLFDEVIAAFNRAKAELVHEMPLIRKSVLDINKSVPSSLAKLKTDVYTARAEIKEIERKYQDKMMTSDQYDKMIGDARSKLSSLNALVNEDMTILADLKVIFLQLFTAIKAVYRCIEFDRLKPIFTGVYKSFLTSIAVSGSKTAASVTFGANFGNILYDRMMQFFGGKLNTYNVVGLVHSICVSGGIFASFVMNELVSLSTVAMVGADSMMHILTERVFNPISDLSKLPHLADSPIMFHSVKMALVIFGFLSNLNPFQHRVSDIIFYPLLAIEAFLTRVLSKK